MSRWHEADKAFGDIAFVGIPNNNDRIAEGVAKTGRSLAQLIGQKAAIAAVNKSG